MSLPKFSVQNPVLVNMLMAVILFAGAAMAVTLVREMFPESRPNKISITAIYPAVQPEELERAVTIKVEEAVRDVEGIEKVDSSVSEGVTTTVLTLYNEVDDVDAVMQEVKNEIDALQDLPEDLEQITLQKLEPRLPVISVAIYGAGDEARLKHAARRMRDDLLLLPGVSDVEISGIRDDEISVEIRPDRLREYDVTFEEIAQAIRETNLDVSGGQLKGERSRVVIRTLGEELRGRDLEDIIVKSRPDGSKVYLSDVATVHDAFIDTDLESYFDTQPAVSCVVYKTSSQDAIQIATLVKAYVKGKQAARGELVEPFDPYGFHAAHQKAWYDKPFSLLSAHLNKAVTKLSGRPDPMQYYRESRQSPFDHNYEVALHSDLARFVEGRLELMTRNGFQGLILVLLCLNLFLNWRVAFWAAVGLPVSFLGAFVVMAMFGATINLLTMFGMIIVLGILVDDAIVIGENIYRHVEEGERPIVAAVKGAEEVMWPVLIAVTTTIGAFFPLFFIEGQIGDFMGQLPLVIIAALSMSLVEALIILPAHLAHLPSRQQQLEAARRRSRFRLVRWLNHFSTLQERFMRGVLIAGYERFLRVSLRWRYVTIAVAVALLLSSLGLFIGFTPEGQPTLGNVVEWEFIQEMDAETLVGAVEMPVGTTADATKERLLKLSDAADGLPEVKSVQMFVALQIDFGGAGMTGANLQSHLGQLVIELLPADERERRGLRSSTDVLAELRQVSATLAGVNSVTWEGMSGGPGGKDVHVQIAGRDFEEIRAVAEELKAELAGYEGVYDLDDDLDEGQRELQLALKPSSRPIGLSVAQLGGYVRNALFGAEARRLTRDREDVKIMVRYPERYRENIDQIESMWMPTLSTTGERSWMPLGEIANVTEAEGYTTIHRSQQQRTVSVFAQVDSETASTYEILDRIRKDWIPGVHEEHPNVRFEFLGSSEEQAKAFSSLKIAYPVALLLIYMMLAGLFRRYFQPMIVMMAIPFGIQGAIVGHWLMGSPMTILSMIGLVALTGIVVNDSLVYVDFVNSRIRAGLSYFEANVEGGRLRLRAILLTTLTTIAGLAPLMFETSFQAKFLIPMAVTLTFGLAFATTVTLIVLPAMNLIYFDLLGSRHVMEEPSDDEGGGDNGRPSGDGHPRTDKPAAAPQQAAATAG